MKAEQGRVAAVGRVGTYAFTKPVREEIVLVAGIGVAGDVHAGVYVKHRARVRADPTQPNLRQVHLMQRELLAEVGEKGYAVGPGDLGENVTTSGVDLIGLPLGTILRFGPPRRERAPGDVEVDAVDGLSAGWVGREDDESAAWIDRECGAVLTGHAGPVGDGPLGSLLAVAAAATLDESSAASAAAIAAAVGRDAGDDPRAAVIVAGLRNPCGQINDFRKGLLKEVSGRNADGDLVRKAGVMAVVLRGGPIRPGYAVVVERPPHPHVPLDRV